MIWEDSYEVCGGCGSSFVMAAEPSKPVPGTSDRSSNLSDRPRLYFGIGVIGIVIGVHYCLAFISGIWLLFIGGGAKLLVGIALLFVGPYAIAMVNFPFLLIGSALARTNWKPPNRLSRLLGFVSALWGNTSIVLWVFLVSMAIVTETGVQAVPYLIWGYSIAIGALGSMAKSEDPRHIPTNIALVLAPISYVLLSVFYLVGTEAEVVFLVLGALVVAVAIIAAGTGYRSLKSSG